MAALLIGSAAYSAGKEGQGHRTLNVTVAKITGDTLFYKTEEAGRPRVGWKLQSCAIIFSILKITLLGYRRQVDIVISYFYNCIKIKCLLIAAGKRK